MISRDLHAILTVVVLVSQLIALGLLFYLAVRVLEFMRFSKEHLVITKRYVDLLDTERGRLARTLEEKAGEIKQEIRVTAAATQAGTKADIQQSAADTKEAQERKAGS